MSSAGFKKISSMNNTTAGSEEDLEAKGVAPSSDMIEKKEDISVEQLDSPSVGFWASILRAETPAVKLATSETYGGGILGEKLAGVDNYFRATDRGGDLFKEFIGGITTFFAMAYILVGDIIIILFNC